MGFSFRAQKAPRIQHTNVAIDLGTCWSRVASWQNGDTINIPDEIGSLVTPSVVAFTNNGVLVGEAARAQMHTNIKNTIVAPQRLVGSKFSNPCVQWYAKRWPVNLERDAEDRVFVRVSVNGKDKLLAPEDILSHLLIHLRRFAEHFLGMTVLEAVLTVPSLYGGCQREALLAACTRARLFVLSLVNCPTACGVAYAILNRFPQRQIVLICCAGEAFFDFALLTIEYVHLTEASVGTVFLDLDGCLSSLCRKELKQKYGVDVSNDEIALRRLRDSCELAKRQLTIENGAVLRVKNVANDTDYVCMMTRKNFEKLCKRETSHIVDALISCLEDAGTDKSMVDQVIIVGGSSHVPLLPRMLFEFFHGKVPLEIRNPEQAAVLGAAALAASLADAARGEGLGSEELPSTVNGGHTRNELEEEMRGTLCQDMPIPLELQHLRVTQCVTRLQPPALTDSSGSADEEDVLVGQVKRSTSNSRTNHFGPCVRSHGPPTDNIRADDDAGVS